MPLERADALELHIADLVNTARAEAGLQPVHVEMHLNHAAQTHSDWMAEEGQLSHEGDEGSTPTDRVEDAEFPLEGGSWHLTENVAYKGISGDPEYADIEEMHAALMQSSSHQANILDPNVDYLGIGLSSGQMQIGDGTQDVVYLTQNFASTSQPVLVQEEVDGAAVTTTYVDGEPVEGTSRPVDREEEDAEQGRDHDADEEPEQDEDDPQQEASNGSCFVATAAYGDRMHPDVVLLRRLRDDILVHRRAGRAFICAYWIVGPRIARLVRAERATGRAARMLLVPCVAVAAWLVPKSVRRGPVTLLPAWRTCFR